jgi:hypothetical protein
MRNPWRVSNKTGEEIDFSDNALLYFPQRENDGLAPDLLHNEFGKITLQFILVIVEGKVKQLNEECT